MRRHPPGGVTPEPPQHVLGYTDYSSFNVPNRWTPCLAESPEDLIERLIELPTIQKAVDNGELAVEN
jgi:hypothetical protein